MKFTVTEAVKLAHERFNQGSIFTLPNIYPDWSEQEFGPGERGLFGIAFNRYVNKTSCGIKRIGKDANSDALYLML